MTRPARNDSGVAARNPKRSRERILSAALKEFAAKGFAGARVDAIARRAAINKRMLYHYFGDKEHLFREVMRLKMAERQAWAENLVRRSGGKPRLLVRRRVQRHRLGPPAGMGGVTEQPLKR